MVFVFLSAGCTGHSKLEISIIFPVVLILFMVVQDERTININKSAFHFEWVRLAMFQFIF